jgi:hypothetical protein
LVQDDKGFMPIFKRSRTSSADMPAIRIALLRLLWPAAIVTEERGTFKSFAKKSMQASLALPSTGGTVRDSFSADPHLAGDGVLLGAGVNFDCEGRPDDRVSNR